MSNAPLNIETGQYEDIPVYLRGKWVVSELKTGVQVAHGSSKSEAIKSARIQIYSHSKDEILKIIERKKIPEDL